MYTLPKSLDIFTKHDNLNKSLKTEGGLTAIESYLSETKIIMNFDVFIFILRGGFDSHTCPA